MSSIGRVVKENYSGLYWCTRHYTKAKRKAIHTLYALIKHFDDLSSSTISSKEKKLIEKNLFFTGTIMVIAVNIIVFFF